MILSCLQNKSVKVKFFSIVFYLAVGLGCSPHNGICADRACLFTNRVEKY